MYSRSGTPDDDFGVSGKLWQGVLVMYDRATESLWTQIDGRAIDGPRTGERLEHLDSDYTTWAAWRKQHPETLVLLKPEDERDRVGSVYADYLGDPERLFLPELNAGLGGVAAKDVVFGARLDGAHTAVTEALLERELVVNGFVGRVPIAWIRDPAIGAVRAVDRRFEGQVLVLAPGGVQGGALGRVRDVISDVPLHPDTLARVRVDRSFWYGWKRSFPNSTVLAD